MISELKILKCIETFKSHFIFRVLLACALNKNGGVELHGTVTCINVDELHLSDPKFIENGYYIVVEAPTTFKTISHLQSCIAEKSFDAKVTDYTEEM